MDLDLMRVQIIGATPLLLHNGRTANPLDPYSKKMKSLTSKRQKTEEDIQELLLVQWESGLYFSDKIGLYMPSENMFAATYKAAKKHKLGVKCGGISFSAVPGFPILTENAKDFVRMKEDPKNKFVKTVVVQKSKTISCRPIFEEWALNFELEFEPTIIDANEIKTILVTMSQRIGLGVWCPGSPKPGIHGKFLIKSMEWTNAKSHEVKRLEGI